MALDEIEFDKNGGPISVEITCGYAQPGSYIFRLWEADVNSIVMEKQGNFINSDDDVYELPTPNDENDGRIVQSIVVVAMIPGTRNYNVEMICYQDSQDGQNRQELGRITRSGKSSLYAVILNLFAKLKGE